MMAVPMQNMTTDPLAELRDIHLPDPVTTLPVAPGWWLLAGLALVLAILAGRALYRYFKGRRYRREGLAELEALFVDYRRDGNARAYLVGVGQLLKRVAMTRYSRARVACLSGYAWLEFLDEQLGGHEFSMGAGQVLASGLYAPTAEPDVDALHALAHRWIRGHA